MMISCKMVNLISFIMVVFAVSLAIFVKPTSWNMILHLRETVGLRRGKAVKKPTMHLNPSVRQNSDIVGKVGFHFLRHESEFLRYFVDITYILKSSLPSWITRWVLLVLGSKYKDRPSAEGDQEFRLVDIYDARNTPDLSFEENGFTLLTLDQPSATTSWHRYSWTQQKAFQNELRPHIMKLFPNATRIVYGNNNVRGGLSLFNLPVVESLPHLDYTYNDTAREEFFKEHPISEKLVECLLGRHDTEEDEMGVMLGIWKPIYMDTPVCDHPLVVSDAKSFAYEHTRPYHVHFDCGTFYEYHGLGATVARDNKQVWYYYPYQTTDEVLLFTQYTKGKPFANFHTSFQNPKRSCGDYDTRISFEMRAAVYFPKT